METPYLQFPRSDSRDSGFKKMCGFQWAVQWFRVESYEVYKWGGFSRVRMKRKGQWKLLLTHFMGYLRLMQRDVTLSLIKEINLFVCIYSFIDEIFINQTKETNPVQVMSNCSISSFKRLRKKKKSRSLFSQNVFVGKWNWKSTFLDKRRHIHTPS